MTPLDQLHGAFNKWLAIEEDPDVLDVILAVVIDRKVLGDPIWLFLVAPSGSTKTELLRSLYNQEGCYLLSTLTSHTIVSGKEKSNGTIVKGIHSKINGKVIIIPEFTQILTKPREERDALMGQLRDLYDGFCRFGFGTTDEPIEVPCRIGLICGVTPAIDLYQTTQIILGERFLKIRARFDRDAARKQALLNQQSLEEMRQQLKTAVANFLANLRITEPECDQQTLDRIGIYGEIVAHLRTVVTSTTFKECDTSEWMPEPEFATRISQQLLKLARCLAIVRGHPRITEADLATVQRVAFDTVPLARLRIATQLAQTNEFTPQKEIAEKTGLSYPITANSLRQLALLNIVEQSDTPAQYNEKLYRLRDPLKTIFIRLASLKLFLGKQ